MFAKIAGFAILSIISNVRGIHFMSSFAELFDNPVEEKPLPSQHTRADPETQVLFQLPPMFMQIKQEASKHAKADPDTSFVSTMSESGRSSTVSRVLLGSRHGAGAFKIAPEPALPIAHQGVDLADVRKSNPTLLSQGSASMVGQSRQQPSAPLDAREQPTRSHEPEAPGTHWSEQRSTRAWVVTHAEMAWALIHGLTFAGVIKTLCVAGNMVVQVSPIPQVRCWEKQGDTGGADAAPYVSLAFGGWQWCFYGMFAWYVTQRKGFLVLIQSNGLGAILGTYYTLAYFRSCKDANSSRNLRKYLSGATFIALFEFCAVVALPLEKALLLVGAASAFCGFVGAFSVLVTVPAVVKTKNARSIAGPLVTSTMCAAFCWMICGIILQDPMITAPSVASFVACSTCVYLKLTYPSTDGGLSSLGGVVSQNVNDVSESTDVIKSRLLRTARQKAAEAATVAGNRASRAATQANCGGYGGREGRSLKDSAPVMEATVLKGTNAETLPTDCSAHHELNCKGDRVPVFFSKNQDASPKSMGARYESFHVQSKEMSPYLEPGGLQQALKLAGETNVLAWVEKLGGYDEFQRSQPLCPSPATGGTF